MVHFDVKLFDAHIELNPQTDFDKISILAPSCRGVILFADEQNMPVQLLTATNIRQTIRAKLFLRDDVKSAKTNLNEIVRKVYYRKTWNDFASGLWYYRLAKQIYPKNYKKLINFAKPVYLKFETAGNWPTLSIIDIPEQNSCDIYGPFINRKSLQFYKDLIVEVFSLCTRPDYIGDQIKAKSCPYYQMLKCDAPCLGKIDKQQYLDRFENAKKTAGNSSGLLNAICDKMKLLSAQMKFEQAQAMKILYEQFSQKQSQYQWIKKISDMSIVHIDIAEKAKVANAKKMSQFYSAFLIKNDSITELTKFDDNSIGLFIEQLSVIIKKPATIVDKQSLAEQLSIACFYLYRSNRRGIWRQLEDVNLGQILQDIAVI